MATTLQNTRLNAQLSASLSNPLPLETVSANPALNFTMNWVNGVSVNQADQVWADQRTLVASGSETINLVTFSGSLDAVGGALSLARIKALFIQNVGGQFVTESGSLTVGGAGAGAWTPLFSGNTAAKATIPGGANLIAVAPGPIAWAAGGSSGSLLTVANLNSTGSTVYNIGVIGCSA